MTLRLAIACGLLALAALSGCSAPRNLYYWGRYDQLTYASYTAPGKAAPQQQIELLREDVERAKAKGMQVHPGLHAQLGLCYYELGQFDAAAAEWNLEKQLFPESAPLMDRFLEKLAPKEQAP